MPPLCRSGGGVRRALAVVLQPCPGHCNAVVDVHVEVGLINDLLTNELLDHILQSDNTYKLRLLEEVGRCENVYVTEWVVSLPVFYKLRYVFSLRIYIIIQKLYCANALWVVLYMSFEL